MNINLMTKTLLEEVEHTEVLDCIVNYNEHFNQMNFFIVVSVSSMKNKQKVLEVCKNLKNHYQEKIGNCNMKLCLTYNWEPLFHDI